MCDSIVINFENIYTEGVQTSKVNLEIRLKDPIKFAIHYDLDQHSALLKKSI